MHNMKKLKIVCDDKIPFLKGVLEPYAEVLYLPGSRIGREDVRDADALVIRTRTLCDAALLEGSSVRAIATATIGFDHIDTAWCGSHGIFWTNAPGCNSSSVAQYIGAALEYLAGKHSLELQKLTLGVVGVGNVGSKVAALARGLGMKVLLCDPPRARKEGEESFCPLEELLRSSDIVSFHTPLLEEGPDRTFHLLDSEKMALLGKGAIVINSSRGPVVDNATLKAALSKGDIRAAVLDVWEGEPQIDTALLSLVDLGTPHIAGYSADGKANGTAMSVRSLARFFDLPLKDWAPATLPAADFDDSAFAFNYNILRDSEALKDYPSLFEKLRGDYPVRREPSEC